MSKVSGRLCINFEVDTKKYKASDDISITSLTNNDEVRTIQALEIPKKAAIIKDGSTLLSENLS